MKVTSPEVSSRKSVKSILPTFGKKLHAMCIEETNHYEFTYDIDGNTLKVDYALDYVTDCEYTYTVDGEKLTLLGGNGTAEPGKAYELTKQE